MFGTDGFDQLPTTSPNPKVIRNTFGRSSGNTNTNQNQNQNNNITSRSYVVAKPVVLPNLKKSKNNSKSSTSRAQGIDDELSVNVLIDEVFWDVENSDKLMKNISILKESRLAKMFVTFNGRDVKAPSKDLKESLLATFGEAGYELYLTMDRLIWVSSQ